jgi:hypothetical protein
LFIGVSAPYKAVQVATIRKVVVALMKECNVPPQFAPHALRMAASSCALMCEGIDIDDVTMGLWQSVGVFKKHYMRFLPGFQPPADKLKPKVRKESITRQQRRAAALKVGAALAARASAGIKKKQSASARRVLPPAKASKSHAARAQVQSGGGEFPASTPFSPSAI